MFKLISSSIKYNINSSNIISRYNNINTINISRLLTTSASVKKIDLGENELKDTTQKDGKEKEEGQEGQDSKDSKPKRKYTKKVKLEDNNNIITQDIIKPKRKYVKKVKVITETNESSEVNEGEVKEATIESKPKRRSKLSKKSTVSSESNDQPIISTQIPSDITKPKRAYTRRIKIQEDGTIIKEKVKYPRKSRAKTIKIDIDIDNKIEDELKKLSNVTDDNIDDNADDNIDVNLQSEHQLLLSVPPIPKKLKKDLLLEEEQDAILQELKTDKINTLELSRDTLVTKESLPSSVWEKFPPSKPNTIGTHELLKSLESSGGQAISIYDVNPKSPLANLVIFVTGTSDAHLRAIADNVARIVRNSLREEIRHKIQVRGRDTSDWMIVDLNSIVIHVFSVEGREYYKYVEERCVIESKWTHNCKKMTEEEKGLLVNQIELAKARYRTENGMFQQGRNPISEEILRKL